MMWMCYSPTNQKPLALISKESNNTLGADQETDRNAIPIKKGEDNQNWVDRTTKISNLSSNQTELLKTAVTKQTARLEREMHKLDTSYNLAVRDLMQLHVTLFSDRTGKHMTQIVNCCF
jgi:hypothetical protein